LENGTVNKPDIENLARQINRRLEKAYETIHGSECLFPMPNYYENWEEYDYTYSFDPVETGVKRETLIALSEKLNRVPEDFSLNPKLKRLLKKRQQSVETAEGIDWATAESLAFATLLTEGAPIRLSGQDSGRGTFSQRHSVLFDIQSEKRFVPLSALDPKQAPFYVYDSLLSEAGVLGFEYGYSIAQPAGLVLWEAQFGDFVNNAQAIIDLFIASGESKWQRLSGLALLLPHGYEGLGPEHSSARPERFLQLCAGNNIQVCNPTTPSQYFHLLRRQAKSSYRKPLVILTPKSLLRHPLAVSKLDALARDHFQPLLDENTNVNTPKKILFCSGKIYYELLIRRTELEFENIAIVRLEQLYPFPEDQLNTVIKKYQSAKHWHWVQEEPENMGAWQFVRPRLEKLTGAAISYIGRQAASSPATGFPTIYKQEQSDIITRAVGRAPSSAEPAAVS
jgi:2-oxoglutarate dehydrogenase E1 component